MKTKVKITKGQLAKVRKQILGEILDKIDSLSYKPDSDNCLLLHLCDKLAGKDDIEVYLSDLLKHGCVSGIEGEMIYYVDTEAFAKKYLSDILEMLGNLEEEIGEPVRPRNGESIDTNWLAWFGWEEGMRKISDRLGLEF